MFRHTCLVGLSGRRDDPRRTATSSWGMTVTRRRATTTAVGLTALVVSATGALAGSPVAVHPKTVHVSQGDITILQTVVNGGLEKDYDVTLTGPLAVHGWSHTGVLHGTSVAQIAEAFGTGIPEFSVSTDDGVVTGDCGGGRSDDLEDTTTP